MVWPGDEFGIDGVFDGITDALENSLRI